MAWNAQNGKRHLHRLRRPQGANKKGLSVFEQAPFFLGSDPRTYFFAVFLAGAFLAGAFLAGAAFFAQQHFFAGAAFSAGAFFAQQHFFAGALTAFFGVSFLVVAMCLSFRLMRRMEHRTAAQYPLVTEYHTTFFRI